MSAEDFVEAIKNGDAFPEGIVGIVIDGDVNLGGDVYSDDFENLDNYKYNISLPNNLTISGCLNLSYTNITELPKGLSCEQLYIIGCNITSLPNYIKVKRLYARNSSLTCLPKGFSCECLEIQSCKNITELPNDIKVSEKLYADYSSLTCLPNGLCCELLGIAGCNITSLPNGIKVCYLYANNSSLTCLPKGFSCEWLEISGCNITEFPDNLTVSECLYYGPTPIYNEPKNLTLPPDNCIYYG